LHVRFFVVGAWDKGTKQWYKFQKLCKSSL